MEALAIRAETLGIQQAGEIFYKSGMFPDIQSEYQAIVKIMAGAACGLDAYTSMSNINIIKGKVEMNAHLHALHVKQSDRYDYDIIEHTDLKCVIQFWGVSKRTKKWEKIGISSFSQDDAKKAGLISSGGMYTKYPRNMLLSRAMTNGVEWFCPDVFQPRVYGPGEINGISEESQDSPPPPKKKGEDADFETAYTLIEEKLKARDMNTVHLSNSLKSHLGPDITMLRQCNDIVKLRAYYKYLKGLEEPSDTQTAKPWYPQAELDDMRGTVVQFTPEKFNEFETAVGNTDIATCKKLFHAALDVKEEGS